jgi:hypothetical protein
MLHPAMSRAVLADKLAILAAADPRPTLVATGNPAASCRSARDCGR